MSDDISLIGISKNWTPGEYFPFGNPAYTFLREGNASLVCSIYEYGWGFENIHVFPRRIAAVD